MSFVVVTTKLLTGFGWTVLFFSTSLLASLPIGLLLSFGSMSKFKPLRYLVRGFVWIVRGIPLMLTMVIIYYGPPLLFDNVAAMQPRELAVIIALTVNYSVYFSEVFRGGIEGISKGQYEAGQVLGMTKVQIFFRIILLQVIKRILAPMSNEVTTLVKDTSLAKVISVTKDLVFAAEDMIFSIGVWPLFYAGLFYLIFNGLVTMLFRYAEKKLSYYHG